MQIRAGIVWSIVVSLVIGCATAPSALPTAPMTEGPAPAPTDASSPPPATTGPTLTPGPRAVFDRLRSEPLGMASVGDLAGAPDAFVIGGFGAHASDLPFISIGTANGSSWSTFESADIPTGFTSIVHGPLGWVAAAGYCCSRGLDVWSSADGVHWDGIAGPPGLATGDLWSMRAGSSAFAIVASIGPGSSFTRGWISRDGMAWAEAATLGSKVPVDVFVLDDAFLAVVLDGLALSGDGITWRDLPVDDRGPFRPDRIAVAELVQPSSLVVIDTDEEGSDRAVWRGTVAGAGADLNMRWERLPAATALLDGISITAWDASATSLVVLGYETETYTPVALISRDGTNWTRTNLDADAFDGGVPGQIAAGDGAFVAIGWNANAAGSWNPDLWRSSDAITWERTGPTVFGAPPVPPTGPCPGVAPTGPAYYRDLAPVLRPGCFADGPITIRGYAADCGGCGGESSAYSTVPWLLNPLGYAAFWLVARNPDSDPSISGFSDGLRIHLDPADAIPVPKVGTHIEVIGHFADPASASCRFVDSQPVALEPARLYVPLCEQEFVATKIRRL
jgi:hypothetical protein